MINATMCLLRDEGRTLFIYRNSKEGDIHKGYYVLPGGQTERGERGIDCILREFKEETNLRLLEPRLRAIVTFYNKGRVLGGKKDPEDWCVEVYEADKFEGELKAESPDAKPVWVKDSDLEKLAMHQGDRKIFELLKQEGTFEVLVQYQNQDLIKFEYNIVC